MKLYAMWKCQKCGRLSIRTHEEKCKWCGSEKWDVLNFLWFEEELE